MKQIVMDKLPTYPTLAQIVPEYKGVPAVEESSRTPLLIYAIAGGIVLTILLLLLLKGLSHRRQRRTYRSRS